MWLSCARGPDASRFRCSGEVSFAHLGISSTLHRERASRESVACACLVAWIRRQMAWACPRSGGTTPEAAAEAVGAAAAAEAAEAARPSGAAAAAVTGEIASPSPQRCGVGNRKGCAQVHPGTLRTEANIANSVDGGIHSGTHEEAEASIRKHQRQQHWERQLFEQACLAMASAVALGENRLAAVSPNHHARQLNTSNTETRTSSRGGRYACSGMP